MSPIIIYMLVSLTIGVCQAQEEPEVDTTLGSVRGKAIHLSTGSTIHSYLGIPCAKAPVGELRFEAPMQPDPWSELFEAFEPGNACIQALTFTVNSTHGGWSRYSEDCLHLNIYAPQDASGLAVLVYIHGGGFQEGANFGYPGYFMADQDVVFVSVNYRLGIMGFAYTGDDTIPGNMGLLDIVQALTFIQENIAAFGGDPTRVTISGESAGGVNVGLLLMSPLAQGLFHGAILQSGNELVPWGLLSPETNPEKYLESVAEQLDCSTESSQEMVNCLRMVDADTLTRATFNCTLGYECIGFQPVVDGHFLPDTPINLRKSGSYNKVPEMIGLTEDEFYFFFPLVYPGLILGGGLNRTDFDEILYNTVLYSLQKFPDLDRVDGIYQAFRFYYADWPYFDDPVRNRHMLSRLTTDKEFGYGTDLQAKQHSADDLDVFFYVYDFRASYTIAPEWMGTVHSAELTTQFGWSFMEENSEALTHSQANPAFRISNHTALDKQMSTFFTTLWTNFAKSRNPTPEPVPGPNNTSITWSRFDSLNDELNYLLFQDTPEVLRDYRQKDYAFWTEYVDYLVNGTREVDTKYGRVRGQTVYLSSGLGIDSFLGVPYAKAPVGDLRFEAPLEPDPWEDTLDGSRAGNACTQKISSGVDWTHDGWTRYSEDCLNLNIYTPQNASNLAVLIFIHGGSFYGGSNFANPGYFLAERDVVSVSVNYRLGILGFAYTGDDTIPANVGIRDLVQSLIFIQENIAAFGGDPSRVTISGVSAGGQLVGHLMMSPLAAGLFHGAILQSGNDLSPSTFLQPQTNPEKYIFALGPEFDCPNDSSEELISCLRQRDAKTLMEANITECTPGYFCDGFQPVVDGVVLPDTPENLRRSGNYNKVPEIIGLTEDEFNLFTPIFFPGIQDGLNRAEFDNILYNQTTYRFLKYPNTTHRTDDVYQALRFYYADWPHFDDPIKNRDMMGILLTDKSYGYPSDCQAKSHSADGSDVYFYVFDYMMSNTILPQWMGTVHGADLNPGFGWPFMEDNSEAFNHSEANPQFSITGYTETDKNFSSLLMTLWTNFAKSGNPTPEPILGPNNTEVIWSMFSMDQLSYLHLNASPKMEENYRQQDYAFWSEYLPYLITGI